MPRSIPWNTELNWVMIDFERAKILKPPAVLGNISPSQKRKRVLKEDLSKQLEGRRDARDSMSNSGKPRIKIASDRYTELNAH
jgi:hypothetical protein